MKVFFISLVKSGIRTIICGNRLLCHNHSCSYRWLKEKSIIQSLTDMVIKLVLFLLTCLNILNDMDYTIICFLPIPSTERRTRERSELLNVSLVSPQVEFHIILQTLAIGCYVRLKSLLPCQLYGYLLSWAEPRSDI